MVYIQIIQEQGKIILNCHKNSRDGEFFQIVMDAHTRKVLKKPDFCDIDASVAYSRVYMLMEEGKALPKETTAAWG